MRKRAVVFITTLLLLAWFLVALKEAYGTNHPYPRLEKEVLEAVYKIAQHRAFKVRCDLPRETGLGVSYGDQPLISVNPWVCLEANLFLEYQEATKPYSKRAFRQALALAVLVHEAIHRRGPPYALSKKELADYRQCLKERVRSYGYPFCEDPRPDLEGLTECRTIQLLSRFAQMLGASEETANALGHAYMRHYGKKATPEQILPWQRYYRHPDCYDGGPLDIHPGLGDWPNA